MVVHPHDADHDEQDRVGGIAAARRRGRAADSSPSPCGDVGVQQRRGDREPVREVSGRSRSVTRVRPLPDASRGRRTGGVRVAVVIKTVTARQPSVNASTARSSRAHRGIRQSGCETRVVVLRNGERVLGRRRHRELRVASDAGGRQPTAVRSGFAGAVVAASTASVSAAGSSRARQRRVAHADSWLGFPGVRLGCCPAGAARSACRASSARPRGVADHVRRTDLRQPGRGVGPLERVVDDLDAGIIWIAGTLMKQSEPAGDQASCADRDTPSDEEGFRRSLCLRSEDGQEGVAAFLRSASRAGQPASSGSGRTASRRGRQTGRPSDRRCARAVRVVRERVVQSAGTTIHGSRRLLFRADRRPARVTGRPQPPDRDILDGGVGDTGRRCGDRLIASSGRRTRRAP
jgi:hypothetical protein